MAQNQGESKVESGRIYDLICDTVKGWVDPETDIALIKVTNVYDNRYRVNVYTITYVEGRFVPDTKIEHSYFCHLVGDELIDKTIHNLTPRYQGYNE